SQSKHHPPVGAGVSPPRAREAMAGAARSYARFTMGRRLVAVCPAGEGKGRPMVSLDKDAVRTFGREVATFLPDLALMLRGVVADPRVPQSAKVEAGAALAYLVSPRNRLTNVIPVIGQLDDVAVVAFAFRRLVVGAGEPILREHWRGSDRAFHALIGASSALASPAG